MTQVVVETEDGRVRGERTLGVTAFLGIPYGAPTGPVDRFLPPRSRSAWSGVLEADRPGPACPQIEMTTPVGPLVPEHKDEDCLRLSIWSPGTRGRRPVMVWLHGGGYTHGSGSQAIYDGSNLAAECDVVVVTVNHRIGVLGFLDVEEFFGPDYASSGTVGMLDLVAALRWIRDNIAGFGGDPRSVTTFGQSGGGWKQSVLMAMPSADGLFARAILQSGAQLRAISRHTASRFSELLVERLGGSPAALLKVSADDLVRASESLLAGFIPGPAHLIGPVMDGSALPGEPEPAVFGFRGVSVPIIVGTTQDEGSIFLAGRQQRDADLIAAVAGLLGEGSEDLLAPYEAARLVVAAYRETRPADGPDHLYQSIYGDWRFLLPAMRFAEGHTAAGRGPAYVYRFARRSDPVLGAYHFAEVPLLFGPARSEDAERDALAERMKAAWTSFARDGQPTGPALPDWEPYRPPARPVLFFDADCRVEHDPDGALRRGWDLALGRLSA